VEESVQAIRSAAAEAGRPADEITVAYQTTVVLADSPDAARESFAGFIAAYYPTFGERVDLGDWGPVGTPDDVAAWVRRFADAGATRILIRFGSMDPVGDLRRFARDVMPAVADRAPGATDSA